MEKDMEAMGLAEAAKGMFLEKFGELKAEDFVAVAELLGFYAHKKTVPEERLKSVAESYFPDIIGTNLEYGVEAYVWETHVPMTEEGKIVSGFWDRRKIMAAKRRKRLKNVEKQNNSLA